MLRFILNGDEYYVEEHEMKEVGFAFESPINIYQKDGTHVRYMSESATAALQVEWWAEDCPVDFTWLTFIGEGPNSCIRFTCGQMNIATLQDLVGIAVYLPTDVLPLSAVFTIKDCMDREIEYRLDPLSLDEDSKKSFRALLRYLKYWRDDKWTWRAYQE